MTHRTLTTLSLALVTSAAWLMVACSSADEETEDFGTAPVGDGDGMGGTTTGGGGAPPASNGGTPATDGGSGATPAEGGAAAGGMASAGGAPVVEDTCSSAFSGEETVSLPFAVDDVFAPSGFMPESEALAETVTMTEDACTGARGKCFAVDFSPQMAADAAEPALAWAGVYWLNYDENWGIQPGAPIASGATKVTFRAWADETGLPEGSSSLDVKFFAGGILGDVTSDDFQQETAVQLTTEPTEYTLEFDPAISYDCVIGGFGWAVGDIMQGTSVKFYVDDVRWE